MIVFSRLTLLIPLFLLLSACEPNIQLDPSKSKEDTNLVPCEFVEALDIPLPYSLNAIGDIQSENLISDFQMISRQTGYGMGSRQQGGYPFLVKTTTGGTSWTDISPETDHYPVTMFFLDESIGFVTVHDITGCPNACQNHTVLLKTTDGGDHWEEIQYTNLSGILYHLQTDSEGNLFANLFTTDEKVLLVKSTDQGASFEVIYEVIYENENDGFFNARFSFTIQNDLIYASGKDDMLFVLNTDGGLIDILRTGALNSITGMTFLSNEVILLSTSNNLRLSKDAGKTWVTIREGNSTVIDASLGEGGDVEALILNTIGYCPTDVFRAIDVFAYTSDSGQNWEDGGASENTSLYLSTPYPATQNSTGLLILQNKLYRLNQ